MNKMKMVLVAGALAGTGYTSQHHWFPTCGQVASHNASLFSEFEGKEKPGLEGMLRQECVDQKWSWKYKASQVHADTVSELQHTELYTDSKAEYSPSSDDDGMYWISGVLVVFAMVFYIATSPLPPAGVDASKKPK